MTLHTPLACMVTLKVDSTQGILEESGASQCRRELTVTPSFILSVYWHIDIYMCPVKQICRLHYLFATKLIQSLKKVLGKNSADWRYEGKQTSHRGDTYACSPNPPSTTLHGNIIDNVVRFEKKLAKQIENYQVFEIQIYKC